MTPAMKWICEYILIISSYTNYTQALKQTLCTSSVGKVFAL